MSRSNADCVVIGGGIVGTACARALARAGVEPLLVEHDVIGGGATAAGMGHIVALDDTPAQFDLCRRSQQLWDELGPQLPASAEFERPGTLWIARDERELAAAGAKQAFYRARNVAADIVDATQLASLEPKLRRGLAGGLRVPGDSVLYPPVIAAWLLDDAMQHGARVRRGHEVVATAPGTVTLDDGSIVSTSLVVHATGHHAGRLVPGLRMRPRKGHLAITDRHPGFVHHQLIELGYLDSAHGSDDDSVAFNVQPRSTGQLLIGSSRQFDDTTSEIHVPLLARMLQRALEYVPALADLTIIRTWTGFRAATADNLPLIGAHPRQPGVYLATGHEGLGITQSLATAELLTELVLNQETTLDRRPFDPARYIDEVARAG